jgi:hypothetical protein
VDYEVWIEVNIHKVMNRLGIKMQSQDKSMVEGTAEDAYNQCHQDRVGGKQHDRIGRKSSPIAEDIHIK